MGNGIYDEISSLRPRRRRKRRVRGLRVRRPAGVVEAPEAADPPAAPPAPAAPAAPPLAVEPGPEPDHQPRIHTPMGGDDWEGQSRLQASLDHLRSRSSISRPPRRERPPSAPPRHTMLEPASAAPAMIEQASMPEPEPAANDAQADKQRKRRKKRMRKPERERRAPSAAGPLPSSPEISRTNGKAMSRAERRDAARNARRQARENHQKAKEAIATTRRVGKAQIAEAKGRARDKKYLAAVIPAGDWNRRQLRRHMATARRQAKAEAAELGSNHSLAISKMRAQARNYRLQSRRWRRPRGSTPEVSFTDSRVVTIRAGIVISWLGLAGFTGLARDSGRLEQPDLYWLLIGLGGGLLVLSTVPWRRMAERPWMSLFSGLWLLLLGIASVALADHHESALALFVGPIWIILFAAVLLPRLAFATASILSIGAYAWAVENGAVELTSEDLMVRAAALSATALIAGFTAHGVRSQAAAALRRLRRLEGHRQALANREAELLQLYEVSRTIGAGELREVLPELVARTAGYIGAKVGLVILHRPEEDALVALSPLWVAGQSLEAEGYRFDPAGESTAAAVFHSGNRYLRNSLSDVDIARDQLLADLGVERVAAVPLRVEGAIIGVLLVADKPDDFTEKDMSALELLSTPAGLVLNHLARYEDAQETGRRMREVAQLKSDFVSVVSHELRTPLTSVIGALSTLTRPELAPDNPVAMSLLDSASTQAHRLKTLIEDLLTVSKIDNQALPIRLEVVEVDELIRRLIERVPAWSGHVDLELSPRIPPVALDPDHFERILTNLLDNARKYASESRIEISARTVGEEVWVSVIDHGEGIPYEYEARIFERFTQIERADTRFKGGTGLGLNIVKDLTEAMQGRVWLESTPGSGATFILAFPRADENATTGLQVGDGLLLVDPSRDRVEAPINVDDLAGGGESPIAE